jgi:phosphoribosylformimino-5-aminoimidazole carboxamide ribotide isomerase
MDVWNVYPAIDLRQGRVVRLAQGDPRRETAYGSDPLRIARRWQAGGAQWVHVVNLDGALGEAGLENAAALERILRESRGLRVQFGGGLRSLASMERALALGVSRVVVGTAAVREPGMVREALGRFGPERVAVAIDARGGRVRTHGWREGTDVEALDLARAWAERGLRWLIFTDVARDGMGRGLNLRTTAAIAAAAAAAGLHVIASGGVADLDDVRRARESGAAGVIIGRALYEGELALEDALRIGGPARSGAAGTDSGQGKG